MGAKNRFRSATQPKPELAHGKKMGDGSGPHGKLPHEVAERANMKRQKKKMHDQHGKRGR